MRRQYGSPCSRPNRETDSAGPETSQSVPPATATRPSRPLSGCRDVLPAERARCWIHGSGFLVKVRQRVVEFDAHVLHQRSPAPGAYHRPQPVRHLTVCLYRDALRVVWLSRLAFQADTQVLSVLIIMHKWTACQPQSVVELVPRQAEGTECGRDGRGSSAMCRGRRARG